MPNPKNVEQVKLLTESLNQSQGVVFVDYQGLKTNQLEALRNSIEVNQGQFHITKNTLLAYALRQSKHKVTHPEVAEFNNPTATLYLNEDIVAPIKALAEFIEQNELPTIKGGIIDEKFYSIEEINQISQIPNYEELISQLLRNLSGPMAGLVNVINGNLRNLVGVLSQIKDHKGGDSNGES